MKQLKFTRLLKTMLLASFMGLIGQSVWAYDIVSYPLTGNVTSTSADVPANAGKSFTTTAGAISYPSGIAQNTGWNGGGKYWQTATFSTFGYHTIGVSAVMSSDNNIGPRDFRLDYSLNGGTSWSATAVATYSITAATGTAYTANLPQACQNQASVMLRWTNTSTIAVNKIAAGTVTALGKSYISTVSVTGYTPSVPATQAHNITIVSRTPTTITVGWTKGGNNDSVVVMMNTTNSFTPLPVNDQSFTAITGTYTSGRQIIYVGTKSEITISVNSATDQYYFRVFDFIPNNGMDRYITTSSDDVGTVVIKNPVLCALEVITINPAISIKLTTATMGATITPTKKSTISQRAIYWDINPGVTELTGNKLSDNINADQSFSFPDEVVNRGTTIYFVASVTNASGTIWSSESSFNNVPVFTGTGNWEDGTKWNVQQVPGANGDVPYVSGIDSGDSPIINGNCTLTSSNEVDNLTINSAKKLTINTAVGMNVVGDLTNSNTNGAGILIKSASSVANGSLTYGTESIGTNATVEMYTKSYMTALPSVDHYNKWQFFGIPVNSVTVGNSFNGYPERVRKYNEANVTATSGHPEIADYGLWSPADALESQVGESSTMTAGQTLVPIDGYEVVQPSSKTYSFSGILNHGDFSKDLGKTLGADWAGYHILANPFPAALNISGLTFGSNLDAVVYLYNSGSRLDWATNNGGHDYGVAGVDGLLPGQYVASNGANAGVLGIPSQIPSMQGFCVLSNGNTNNTFGMPYSAVMTNNTAQRAPSSVQTEKVATRIDVFGTYFADRMWIFTEPTCTRNFDNGFDGYKLTGSSLTPQIYAMETSDDYQIDAVNDMNNTYLGFKAGLDTELKLRFTHQNVALTYGSIYLVDLVANKTIDITASGTEYSFTATAADATKRFKIITQTTGTTTPTENNAKLKMYNTQEAIFIQNFTDNTATYMLYNVSGKLMQRVSVNANSIKTISTKDLNAGVYIAKSETETEKVTQRFIIR